jgi:hypothetical protein
MENVVIAAKAAFLLWVLGFFTLPITSFFSKKINDKMNMPELFCSFWQSSMLALGRFLVLFLILSFG